MDLAQRFMDFLEDLAQREEACIMRCTSYSWMVKHSLSIMTTFEQRDVCVMLQTIGQAVCQ